MNNKKKLMTQSGKLKIHKADWHTISSDSYRFSTYFIFPYLVFLLFIFLLLLLFFFFLFFFDTNSTVRVGERQKRFHPADFWKQDYFFCQKPLKDIYLNLKSTAQEMKFFFIWRIPWVNVTKSAGNWGFGNFNWRNP